MKQRHRYARLLALVAVLSLVAAGCANDDDPGATDGDTTDGASGEVDCATVEFGCVEVGADEPINIGTLLVLSGADQSLGQDALYGVQLAIDYLDGSYDQTDGTLLDHPVELVSEDELCTAEGGQAGATALAADTSIVAVIGTSCSSAALGVADTIFSDKGMLLLSPSNTNPALTTEGTHQPFYARTAHNDRIQGAIVAEFSLGELGATSAATIADESPYTQGLTAAFEQNFEAGEGSITGSEQINSLDTDFQPVLRTLAEGDPDVLYFPVFVAACTLLIQQAQEIMPETALVVSDGCLSSDTVKNAGDAIDGVYASSPDLSAFEGNPAYADEFIPAYLESFNTEGTLSVFHAHAFDASNALFDAIEQVAVDNGDGSLSIPRQALRDAVFATSGYEGLSGTITCTELGDCATDVTIGIFEAPGWPVEGGDLNAKAIYSDTKSLDDVL
jgi:branched-chain amino acid transport system substrate-binding protein